MNSDEMVILKQDADILSHFMSEIDDLSSWTSFKNTPDSKIYYKLESKF